MLNNSVQKIAGVWDISHITSFFSAHVLTSFEGYYIPYTSFSFVYINIGQFHRILRKKYKTVSEDTKQRLKEICSMLSWDQTVMIDDESLSKSRNVLAQLFLFLAFLVLSFTIITRYRNVFLVFDTLTPSLASDSHVFIVSSAMFFTLSLLTHFLVQTSLSSKYSIHLNSGFLLQRTIGFSLNPAR